ncbi:MAG: UvrD-helicase domain-containing protein [Dehalococcoidia bacterium]|nr:UvrD-helicase domain-containing protein [Dehalococcoidia bacterium]
MSSFTLTQEQISAATNEARYGFIEASPGSGKTTVAAHRFGVMRFSGRATERSATAISFTRSATAELALKVTNRWGRGATAWPSRVTTIDGLILELIQHLLRKRVIRWPSDHVELRVLDEWRGHAGYRWLAAGSFHRVATINADGEVTSIGRRVGQPGLGIGNAAQFEALLEKGLCTHGDLRDVLAAALRRPEIVEAASGFLAAARHLVVDEVFDANELDLQLVEIAAAIGAGVTLIGDPWQALYGFRGARPDLVGEVLDRLGFRTLPLTQSFRFKTEKMRALSSALRTGAGVGLDSIDSYDVVLAHRWQELWNGPAGTLPLSFGAIRNQTDAATIILLDQLTWATFGRRAIFLNEALILLGLDLPLYTREGGRALAAVMEALPRGDEDAARRTLNQLRDAIRSLGVRRPRALAADAEEEQADRLRMLAARSRWDGRLVPGLTIHQAKGREWDNVGLLLPATDLVRLGEGLNEAEEAARTLYVALTRARFDVGLVA